MRGTENTGDLGKVREARMLTHSILTDIPDIEGSDFYPELAKVGNSAPSAGITLGLTTKETTLYLEAADSTALPRREKQ